MKYLILSKFLGLVTYLDWIMILVTIVSAMSMSFETPVNRVFDEPLLQVNDRLTLIETSNELIFRLLKYTFVICMSVELTLKVFAAWFILYT